MRILMIKEYAPSGLPLMEIDTIKYFVCEIYNEGRVEESVCRMEEDNPFIAETLRGLIGRLGEDLDKNSQSRLREGFAGGFCAAYTLLRLQAEKQNNSRILRD